MKTINKLAFIEALFYYNYYGADMFIFCHYRLVFIITLLKIKILIK